MNNSAILQNIIMFQRSSQKLRTFSPFTDLCAREEHRLNFSPTLKNIVCGNDRSLDRAGADAEKWRFCVAGAGAGFVFSAANCCVCGEYKQTQTHVYDDELDIWYVTIPFRILCTCKSG